MASTTKKEVTLETKKFDELNFGDGHIWDLMRQVLEAGYNVYVNSSAFVGGKDGVRYFDYEKNGIFAHCSVGYFWDYQTSTRHEPNKESGVGYIVCYERDSLTMEDLLNTWIESKNNQTVGTVYNRKRRVEKPHKQHFVSPDIQIIL